MSEGKSTMTTSSVSRRAFIGGSAAAGGLALGFDIGLPGIPGAVAQSAPSELGLWVVVAPDDIVTIRVARSEMGQGSLTGLCQLVAEELGCDWSKVRWEYVSPEQNLAAKRAWGDMATSGSRAIRNSHEYVRKGGAQARMMLIEAAAQEWKVPAAEITVDKGVISHKAYGKTTTYGKVAAAAAKLTPPADVPLKDPKTWTIAGKGLPRLDTVDKTVGKQIYAADVVLPGMLNAAIKDAPVFGEKIVSFDDAKAKTMPGVKKIVKVGDSALAVVADTWWRAKTALDAIEIKYTESASNKISSETIAATLKEGLTSDTGIAIGNKTGGDVKAALGSAAKTFEAVYSVPYIHHATMEPMAATARVSADKCEVWTSTQNAEDVLAAASASSGLPLAQCAVTRYTLGGGFGRKTNSDFVRQAVLVAKEFPGTPVKLLWSREQDMARGWYRPAGNAKLTAGVDANGKLTALNVRISAPSILATAGRLPADGTDPNVFQGLQASGAEGRLGYKIDNVFIDRAMRNNHIPVWFWRGVNTNQNAIWMECFVDELAKFIGKDPLAFRREMLVDAPKHLGILNAVAEAAGYDKPLPAGVFRGISQFHGYGSYCAAVAEVSVNDRGRLKVHRVVAGVDSGHVVNPDQVKAQVEGSVAYGLGAALYQENTVKDGRIVETNFDTFECMRIDEMPKVDVVLAPSGGFWGGVGEPTIAVTAPAVLNGIFAATGKMPRDLPLKNVKLRQA